MPSSAYPSWDAFSFEGSWPFWNWELWDLFWTWTTFFNRITNPDQLKTDFRIRLIRITLWTPNLIPIWDLMICNPETEKRSQDCKSCVSEHGARCLTHSIEVSRAHHLATNSQCQGYNLNQTWSEAVALRVGRADFRHDKRLQAMYMWGSQWL